MSSFETHVIAPGLRLHVKPTRQFKTTTVRIHFTRNLDRGTTRAALLPYILRRGTRSHPTMVHMSRHLEYLYGTTMGTNILKVGEWQVLSFGADVPNERCLGTRVPVLERALEFLGEAVFLPAGDGSFREEYVRTEIDNMRKFIVSLVENRAAYAMQRLVEILCGGEPFARYEYGSPDALESIQPSGLYRFYRSTCRRAPIDIYVLGDVGPEQVLRSVERIFRHPRTGRYRLSPPVLRPAGRKVKLFREHLGVAQAHLLMGYRSTVAFSHRLSHALALAGAILGGFPHSKLFRTVREKASLAYSVGAHVVRTKGIMVAYAGTEPGNEAKVQRLIEREVGRLKAGRISSFEMESTRSGILDELASITDSPAGEIEFHFAHLLHGERKTPLELSQVIRGLTRAEVTAAANRLLLDTVYVLTKPAPGDEPA